MSLTSSLKLVPVPLTLSRRSADAPSNGPQLTGKIDELAQEYGKYSTADIASLCSAQNQRAACKAAERSFSNTPQSVPPRVRCMRVLGKSYTAWLSSRAIRP